MDRTTKEASVEELSEIFGNAGAVVLANYSGLTVAEMTELRGKLREQGSTLKVVRNRLAKIALKGQKGEGASDLFSGPVAIAYSEDFTAAPKVVVEYAKSNDKFEIIGGFMEEDVFDTSGIEALSKMPSREELIATIVARMLGQAGEIVSRVTAPGSTLAGQIEVIGEKAEA
jgi:large subunit ribosomal protein L10